MKNTYYILGILAGAFVFGGSELTNAGGVSSDPLGENGTETVYVPKLMDKDAFLKAMSGEADDTTHIDLIFNNASEAIKYMQESGHWDEYSSGIIPKMVETNLDYASKLLNNTHDGFIVVDKGRMKLIRYDKYGDEVAVYGMACGKNYGTKHKRSDCRTPEGFFSVKRIQNSTDWKYVDDDGNVSTKTGEFGPRFIRLDIPGITSIGIHGTCAPWSIGGRRSHGCIRLKNENIMELVEHVEVGMPVIVSPGTRDQKINKEEGYDIPRISTIVG